MKEKFQLVELENSICFLTNENRVITTPAEAMELLGEVSGGHQVDKLITKDCAWSTDFFDLSTGFLGEVLQKYANYFFKMAIIGDFSKYPSQVLPDFIRESNRGRQFFFVDTQAEAMAKLNQLG